MNAVFIHIPKTGGITVEAALQLQPLRFRHRINKHFSGSGYISFGHYSYQKLVREGIVTREFDRTSFKFAFCRNPYDRAVSHWCYVMRKHPNYIPRGTSFLEFTRAISNPKIKRHFRLQYLYVDGINLDFLGRFENFMEDLEKVALMLDIHLRSVPHSNGTVHGPYKSYYCEESKSLIEDFYDKDFKYFGYEHDDNLLH